MKLNDESRRCGLSQEVLISVLGPNCPPRSVLLAEVIDHAYWWYETQATVVPGPCGHSTLAQRLTITCHFGAARINALVVDETPILDLHACSRSTAARVTHVTIAPNAGRRNTDWKETPHTGHAPMRDQCEPGLRVVAWDYTGLR